MSTSFLVESEVRRWADRLGLQLDLVGADPYIPNTDYRISRKNGGRQPEKHQHLFQGSMDRCSDFLRGFLHADSPDAADDLAGPQIKLTLAEQTARIMGGLSSKERELITERNKQLDEARRNRRLDTERLDWLDDDGRIEDVRGRMVNENETVRQAIDSLRGAGASL